MLTRTRITDTHRNLKIYSSAFTDAPIILLGANVSDGQIHAYDQLLRYIILYGTTLYIAQMMESSMSTS